MGKKNLNKLKPNERYILEKINSSKKLRFSMRELSTLTGMESNNLWKYVENLAKLDYIDVAKFGYIKEVLKK